jgi:hypothetical protein
LGFPPDLVTVSAIKADSVDGQKYARHSGQKQQVSHDAAYFNCDEIDEKVVLSFVPRPFTTAMMAMEIPAAIRPYSMAVAPDSSAKNWRNFVSMPGRVGYSSKALVK